MQKVVGSSPISRSSSESRFGGVLYVRRPTYAGAIR
jgi:hypothetical protein